MATGHERGDHRKGVIFISLGATGCKTLEEALKRGWKDIAQEYMCAKRWYGADEAPGYYRMAEANMVWVYDGDHMITIKDRHAKPGRIERISEVTDALAPFKRLIAEGNVLQRYPQHLTGVFRDRRPWWQKLRDRLLDVRDRLFWPQAEDEMGML